MFTGIVEALGHIKKLPRPDLKQPLVIETNLGDIAVGDSVCVQGVCLTAVFVKNKKSLSRDGRIFEIGFDLSKETYQRTTFGMNIFRQNSPVNLERALRADSRLGGHFVSGHVDVVGDVHGIRRSADSITVGIAVPSLKYLVFKGSVALDGVSLTISDIEEERKIFYITLIPHTLKNTTFNQTLKIGQFVNVEYDLLAKYALKSVSSSEEISKKDGRVLLTKEKLKDAGFTY